MNIYFKSRFASRKRAVMQKFTRFLTSGKGRRTLRSSHVITLKEWRHATVRKFLDFSLSLDVLFVEFRVVLSFHVCFKMMIKLTCFWSFVDISSYFAGS